MSDYIKNYVSVIRYAMAPENRVREFFAKYEEKPDKTVLGALADYLDEQDDPRSIIIRRHLEQTSHPKGYDWKEEFHTDPDDNHTNNSLVTTSGSVVSDETGSNRLTFAPVAYRGIFNSKPKTVYINWNHRYAPRLNPYERMYGGEHPLLKTNNTHLGGTFTVEEARQIADSLYPDQTEKVHKFLDTHFGPR